MNLLDKKLSFGVIMMALILLISCEETGGFGLDDEDISPVDFFSENISVGSSVLLIDSIPTSDGSTMLVGSITNDDFGTTQARAFSKLNLNKPNLVDLLEDVVLDSVRMNVKFNYVHNSEKNIIDLKVGRVAQNAIFDSLAYFTTSEAPRVVTNVLDGSTPLIASGLFEVSNLDSTYALSVNPAWSDPLFELLKANDPSVADQESFESQFLGGLAFIPGEFTTGAFGIETLGVSDGETASVSNIVFYFHQSAPNGTGDINFTQALTFNDAKHFYVLETDRAGAATAVVQETGTEYLVDSDLRYIQEGNAIVTKLDVSALMDFVDANPDVIINFGELSIGPLETRPADNGLPPEELILYLTDDRNTLIRDGNVFRGVQSDGANQIASSVTLTLEYDSETNSYTSSITSFIQSYYSEIFQRDELVLFTSNVNSSLNGMVFDKNNVQLKVFYSELK